MSEHGPVDLNQAIDPWCDDQSIEIAWDQWARVRIFCIHGTAEGVSGGLCLNEAFAQAIKSYKAIDHSPTLCWADCEPPAEWLAEDELWWDQTSECDLRTGHEGPHKTFPEYEGRDADRYEHLVYFKNGHDRTGTPVFGSTSIPHPYWKAAAAVRDSEER
ncbi:Uncharacterised protein [Mycobacteroides abscessus subsp. massiliense]|uniref:Uncharacterized protein n=1 Tax=Mycobacteroides abscessus MAB_091912_2446 TaxID=1335414 RepID=A0A829MCX3_9MYCO|nr:hypothetical protein DDT53_16035 [Mycobacteroides abscessus]EHB98848.1 hypothetical protein MAB47J26_08937 [Mycobacteroides abscessus 47J26]EIU86237.1 hypothetical protein MM2B0626_0984 [Mycobacteroides abscessus subsp. bolletii 2B-0626]EIV14621.1 hypothetical protein MM2B0912R_1385 [Mycobacteroides abscessus subsp. bolletii 2B-0912-R]EIV27292.1 hypothetical protein MM2B0912S_0985 [Mycobacteroides abscessus subsp. bolletii 2B-0912-S]EIV80387.1 hypothetical protein MM2B1231_1045 [Mycobactero